MKTILFLLVIALWTTMGCAIFQKITTPTVGTYIGTDIVVDGESFRYNAKINKSSNKRHVKVQKELTLKRAMNRKKVVPLHGRKTRYRESYS